jgi:hypothetical protein
VLRDARAAKKRRLAVVAGSRVDFHVGKIIRDGRESGSHHTRA